MQSLKVFTKQLILLHDFHELYMVNMSKPVCLQKSNHDFQKALLEILLFLQGLFRILLAHLKGFHEIHYRSDIFKKSVHGSTEFI